MIFPTLAGIDIAVKRTPIWATKVQTTSSGKELRASWQSTPRWRYEFPVNFVRRAGFSANTPSDEMTAILSLFNAVRGKWDSFLYTDPYSNTASFTPFGTGNGTTTAFQLLDIEGYSVFDMNGTPSVYRTDWQGRQLLYSTARTNLLKFSDQFDNAGWVKTSVTVTANATLSPDGTTTSDKIVEDVTNNVHQASQGLTILDNTTYAVSTHAKAGERNWLRLQPNDKGGTTRGAWFNLATGVVGSVNSGTTASIVNLGNGWYRCTVVFNSGTGASACTVRIAVATGDGTTGYTGDGASGLYLWGAQIEVAPAPTSYIPTTTAAVTVTDYTLSGTGLVTLATAPVSGATLTWSGAYYRRVRFDMDEYEQEQMFNLCWNGGTVSLLSVK
nr:DUF2460 domain-containing protein [Geothrix sp. SG10]